MISHLPSRSVPISSTLETMGSRPRRTRLLSVALTTFTATFACTALAQECVAVAVKESHAIFRDEGMILDKCAEFEQATDCVIKSGERLIVTSMALLPRYTTETFFFLRRHDRFSCYPAEDFILSEDCDADSLPMINGTPCEP